MLIRVFCKQRKDHAHNNNITVITRPFMLLIESELSIFEDMEKKYLVISGIIFDLSSAS